MPSKVIRNITKVFRSASGVLFGRATAGTGRGEELTPADVRTLISVYSTSEVDAIVGGIDGLTSADIDTLAEINAILTDADLASLTYVDSELSGKQATLVSGTNIKTINGTTVLGSGDLTVGLSGTGSVDNAALRADGTGGATLQSSAWIINDNLTASPNNTVNHACIEATGGTTNVSVSIKPKGDGAFCLSVPSGTATGGNVRGDNCVDLQRVRTTASQVPSGPRSSILGGERNTIEYFSSVSVICGGYQNSITGFGFYSTIGGGYLNTAGSSPYTVIGGGRENVVTGEIGTISGGVGASSTRYCQESSASGYFAAAGDAQSIRLRARRKTTDATPAVLFCDGVAKRITIPSGKVISVLCRITGIKSDGSSVANYVRRVVIKNVGGTTSLVGSVETIGTDHEDAATAVTITADDANDALDISVTGIAAETWRWVAVVEGLEIAYGT